jgi:hypothetical protein
VSSLGAVFFFVWCHLRWGRWDLYLETQRIGWNLAPDYLGLLKPQNLPLYTPIWSLDAWGAHGVSRVSVPLLVMTFLALGVLEVWVGRSPRSERLHVRAGLYFCALVMFYISVSGVLGLPRGHELKSMVRYGLCVHVMLVMILCHLLSRVPLLPKPARSAAPYLLGGYCTASFLVQLWFICLFAQGEWVG